jgi:DNA-binding CsgD family transcriptional regulator
VQRVADETQYLSTLTGRFESSTISQFSRNILLRSGFSEFLRFFANIRDRRIFVSSRTALRDSKKQWSSNLFFAAVDETNMLHHPYGTRTLTKREHQVIALVAEGLKNREVALALGTTEPVIKNYLRRIYDKLGVWSRVELALWYEARRHEKFVEQTNVQDHAVSVAAAAVGNLPSSAVTGLKPLSSTLISNLNQPNGDQPKLRTGTSD